MKEAVLRTLAEPETSQLEIWQKLYIKEDCKT